MSGGSTGELALVGKMPSREPQKMRLAERGCRFVALERLPRGTSATFPASDLIIRTKLSLEEQVGVRVSGGGALEMVGPEGAGGAGGAGGADEAGGAAWAQAALAPDVHSANLLLETAPEGQLRVLLSRTVEARAELLLWFSQDIIALVDMPFLTPRNIVAHKKYRCHICEENFEYPNPLKLHLLLMCSRESISQLWKKINKKVKEEMDSQVIKLRMDNDIFMSEKTNLPSYPGIKMFSKPITEPPSSSAFMPYKRSPFENISDKNPINIGKTEVNDSITVQPLNLSFNPSSPRSKILETPEQAWPKDILELRLSRSLEEISSNYAADVELFASNWGKIKQGHLCVYCGKVYSRKYGLKIHIRTHTGYKPLKCKVCLRPFGDPSNLNKHVRLHAAGLAPHTCPLCAKVLVRRRDLERHMRLHHTEEQSATIEDDIREFSHYQRR